MLGFFAFTETGKTMHLAAQISVLAAPSVRICVIKHAHQDCGVDQRGRNRYVPRKARASKAAVATRRWGVMLKAPKRLEAKLNSERGGISLRGTDLGGSKASSTCESQRSKCIDRLLEIRSYSRTTAIGRPLPQTS